MRNHRLRTVGKKILGRGKDGVFAYRTDLEKKVRNGGNVSAKGTPSALDEGG